MIYKIISDYRDIIISYDVRRYYQFETSSGIVIDFFLIGGYKLFVKEYIYTDGNRKYSFHFQNDKGEILFRYDNAPHWNTFENFPHHRHADGQVFGSRPVTLAEIFAEIREYFVKYGLINLWKK